MQIEEATMNNIVKSIGASINTGRGKAAGQLGTLAASHCPVNGPCLPEGVYSYDNC